MILLRIHGMQPIERRPLSRWCNSSLTRRRFFHLRAAFASSRVESSALTLRLPLITLTSISPLTLQCEMTASTLSFSLMVLQNSPQLLRHLSHSTRTSLIIPAIMLKLLTVIYPFSSIILIFGITPSLSLLTFSQGKPSIYRILLILHHLGWIIVVATCVQQGLIQFL